MVIRATADDAAFADASATFVRSMLLIGGRLFDDMARDVRPSTTLGYLCEAACDLLGAGDVALRLHDDTLGSWVGFEAPVTDPSATAPEPHLVAEMGHVEDVPLGQLEISWLDPARVPTPLDEVVATRFAAMAMLVLERHVAKRRQLQAIAKELEAFAGEIHDDPVQVITAVCLQLQRIARRLPDGEDRAAIERARALNDTAVERLRHVMFSLHPETLGEDGLHAAIESYCESFVAVEGPACTVVGDCTPRVPIEVTALAFRLCRNALINTVEHADATSISIDIVERDAIMRVQVRDDGVGFDLAAIGHTRVGHLGIPHAVTLARWAGGSYETDSAPGRGTTVTIELPVI